MAEGTAGRRLVALMAALALGLTLAACGNNGEGDRAADDERAGDRAEVVFTARFSEQRCGTLHNVASDIGFDSVEELIRTGVRGIGSVADDGGAFLIEDGPANDEECEIPVTWPDDDLDRVTEIATAWGVTEDQMHHLGGVVVLVLLSRE